MPEKTQFQTSLDSTLFDRLPDNKFEKPQLRVGDQTDIVLSDAFRQSLANPLHYPALDQSVFVGDRIAIALQPGLPHPQTILSVLLERLFDAGMKPDDVVVIVDQSLANQFGMKMPPNQSAAETDRQVMPTTQLRLIDDREIQFHIHDSDNEQAQSYLFANEEGDPVHVNRLLVDADVILPIGYATPGNAGLPVDCLYPEFGSAAVKNRFASETGSLAARREEIQTANHTLGSFFSIQIVSRPGGTIHQIFSGASTDVKQLAQAETNKLWELDLQGEFEVVVATIETSIGLPTWEDFVAALISASQISKPDGPIVIWSEISEKPHRRIRQACLSQFEGAISRKWSPELQLAATLLQDRPVYLRSGLSRNEVEALGIGYIDCVDDILHVTAPCSSGLLLRDAHLCRLRQQSINSES